MSKVDHSHGRWRVVVRANQHGVQMLAIDMAPRKRSWRPNQTGDRLADVDVADARLMVAAPDLLAACEEFVRKCECGEARSVRSYQQMKAAIAKAKGEAWEPK